MSEAMPEDNYTTTQSLFAALPDWTGEDDARRIAAYKVYHNIYWNVPETFKLVQRGTDALPIYIPSGRTIVDTTNRYVANKFSFIMDPDAGNPADQEAFKAQLLSLFRRERFYSKFNMNKLDGLTKGDWLFHITANAAKPEGRRIRIDTLDPAAYFPVPHPDDDQQIIAAHIAWQTTVGDDTFIRRQTYMRGADPVNNDGSDTSIWNSVGLYAVDDENWRDLTHNPAQVVKPAEQLPPQITAIPIYHFRNIATPGDIFGSSELRGFERVMAAVNQAISDEELALALEGLGMYATDAGPPKDDQGNTINWRLGPGRVVELPANTNFTRVDGIGSVTPYMDHLAFLINSIREGSGTPEVAIGKVDVSVAESGVSLAMQMGPMLSKAEERETEIQDVLGNMLFDLKAFLSAYEGFNSDAYAVPVFGEKLPTDRKARIQEILDIVAGGIASADWGRAELEEYGYVFPEDEGDKLQEEQQARRDSLDEWMARASGELTLDGQTQQ